MALQKEIWLAHLVKILFPDNAFYVHAFNADIYVYGGKSVHIPNASGLPGVVKNRAKGTAADVKVIEDPDLKFDIDEYTTDPVLMPNADKYELSYDKRATLLSRSKEALADAVAKGFIKNWSPSKAGRILETSGKSVKAHLDKATGNRKSFCRADVLAAKVMFDNENIPQDNRFMLVDAIMYAQLLEDLTEVQAQAFLASADAQKGILGELYGFKIMMRSAAAKYDNSNAPKGIDEVGAATDCAAALAWHRDYVCRALGDHEAFTTDSDPQFYGDVISFLVRAGSAKMHKEEIGVLAIKQATV